MANNDALEAIGAWAGSRTVEAVESIFADKAEAGGDIETSHICHMDVFHARSQPH